MQMRPEIQITSVIKAVKDVIIPALDPANQLAIEQSQLIIGLLSLMASQLPVQFRFDHDELSRLLAAARTLQEIQFDRTGVESAMNRLTATIDNASLVLGRGLVDPTDLAATLRDLREAVGSVIQSVADAGNVDTQLKVERIVLDMSKDQLLRDRSLMKSQGWEPDPGAVPAIRELLDQSFPVG